MLAIVMSSAISTCRARMGWDCDSANLRNVSVMRGIGPTGSLIGKGLALPYFLDDASLRLGGGSGIMAPATGVAAEGRKR